MNDLTAIVRSWFHEPYAEMGYRAEKRRWGTYWSHRQVYVADLPLEQICAFLDDVRVYYGDGDAVGPEVHINLDNCEIDAMLGPALLDAGCTPGTTEVFLAPAGALPDRPIVPGLTVEPATEANLPELAATRRRAFSDDDTVPDAAKLAAEIAQRRSELSGSARGLLARIEGEPAGLVWWYAEEAADWVVLLGVRAPYRRRGIARWLLRRRFIEAERQGKPLLLNVLVDNARAIRLYRRLGFTDEVYWRWRYALSL